MVANHKVGLTEKNFGCKLRVFVEVNLPCREARMHANYPIQCHNRIGFEHEVFAVSSLRLLRVVKARFVETSYFRTLDDVLGLQAEIMILFDLFHLLGSNIKLKAVFLNHASILSLLNFHLFLSFLFACCSKLCHVSLLFNLLIGLI